jgi:hypothetical protein
VAIGSNLVSLVDSSSIRNSASFLAHIRVLVLVLFLFLVLNF